MNMVNSQAGSWNLILMQESRPLLHSFTTFLSHLGFTLLIPLQKLHLSACATIESQFWNGKMFKKSFCCVLNSL